MKSRRAEKRLRVAHKMYVGFVGAGVHFTGDLMDISRSGLLVRCSQDLKPGSIGRLGIPLGQDVVRIVAAVRRRVPSVGIAFEFLQMSQRDRMLLQRLLLRLQNPAKS